jgi:hypothetical protein
MPTFPSCDKLILEPHPARTSARHPRRTAGAADETQRRDYQQRAHDRQTLQRGWSSVRVLPSPAGGHEIRDADRPALRGKRVCRTTGCWKVDVRLESGLSAYNSARGREVAGRAEKHGSQKMQELRSGYQHGGGSPRRTLSRDFAIPGRRSDPATARANAV